MHVDVEQVDAILDRYPSDESSLVMVLQDVQSRFSYLPPQALQRVAERLGVPRARVYSVATFYRVFSLEPQGRNLVQICKGTACHVRGAQQIEDELCRQLELPPGGGTTADREYTVRTVNCVGACAMAPVVLVGEQYHGGVKPSQIRRVLRRATSGDAGTPLRPAPAVEPAPPTGFPSPEALLARIDALQAARTNLSCQVLVCGGPGCLAAGARALHRALAEAAEAADVPLRLALTDCMHGGAGSGLLTLSGCQGLCQQGPLVQVTGPQTDLLYTHVAPTHAGEIVESLRTGAPVTSLLGDAPGRAEHPFYRGQVLRALRTCGRVDPESLEDYLAHGGFACLARTLQSRQPADVLGAVERSGLRGRGGAGFSTGRKWRSAIRAARAAGRPPYLLCNGDEGDPGAFMDRAIMEGSPYQVLEGMLLGAHALGAQEGYLYVRAEYPLAVERLERAMASMRRAGLLGERILGSRLSFDLRISRGGGAFVCGESTALMRSIEGKVGEPRAKYTRSVERGLYDAPTVLNNVETWALVPGIVDEDPDAAGSFAALGTSRSRGTKAFSLTGQVVRTGLVEVPMGTTLRRLIFDIGGGVPAGRRFKAVQTGGPSGGCLPASELDLPVDFEALDGAGSMMGSGGMIVMDDRTCMVDVARYFVDFLLEESCGKCTACRAGLPQLSYLLGRLTRGVGTSRDIEAIEAVCATMAECSLCGLGKSAPNPVLSTLRYFRDEYDAHLAGRCPAGVCRELISYEITDACIGCLLCIKPCPAGAISGSKEQVHVIDQSLCTRCGICESVCGYDAVRVVPRGGRQ